MRKLIGSLAPARRLAIARKRRAHRDRASPVHTHRRSQQRLPRQLRTGIESSFKTTKARRCVGAKSNTRITVNSYREPLGSPCGFLHAHCALRSGLSLRANERTNTIFFISISYCQPCGYPIMWFQSNICCILMKAYKSFFIRVFNK